MNVKQLIKKLSEFPPDLDVYLKPVPSLASIQHVFFVHLDKVSSFGVVEDCVIITEGNEELERKLEGIEEED